MPKLVTVTTRVPKPLRDAAMRKVYRERSEGKKTTLMSKFRDFLEEWVKQ